MIQGFGQEITEISAFGYDITEVRAMGLLVWQKHYLCFTAIESGTFTFTIPASINTTDFSYVEYSLDQINWVRTNNVNSTLIVVTTPTIALGKKVYWRGIGRRCATSGSIYSIFSSTGNFSIGGYIISLLYGENFKNYIDSDLLYEYSFACLFKECSTLIYADELRLPHKRLTRFCYYLLFYKCINLLTGASLNAEYPNSYSYYSIYEKCSSLTSFPKIEAISCEDSEGEGVTSPYYRAFQLCGASGVAYVNVKKAEGDGTFSAMFYECSNLIGVIFSIEGNVGNLAFYRCMYNCSNLRYIKCLIDPNIEKTEVFYYWVYHVSASGVFVLNSEYTWNTGNHGIPTNWVINPNWLCFEALESGTFTLTVPAAVTSTYLSYVEYSLDGINWTRLTIDSTDQTITTPTIAAGGKVYWRGSGNCMTNLSASVGNNAVFSSTARFDASGHLLSLLKGDDFSDDALVNYNTSGIRNVTFANLFRGCTTLVNAVDLVLPQFSSFYTYIYASTFYGCTSLLTVPALPCTTLATSCYQGMFQGCSSLAVAPLLPATTLVANCYYVMFSSCTSLTEMPVLSATALATNCYRQMFQYCSSLTTTHDLPATTLASECYRSMFYGCSALVSAPKILATTLAQNCCNMMFRGCTSLTSAPQLLATTLATSCYQEMFGGCTSLAIAPELPSTTLVETCYKWMFNGCTSLSYVKCLATNISATDCLLAWMGSTGTGGTFIKDENTTYSSGASGIPSSWLIYEEGGARLPIQYKEVEYVETGARSANNRIEIGTIRNQYEVFEVKAQAAQLDTTYNQSIAGYNDLDTTTTPKQASQSYFYLRANPDSFQHQIFRINEDSYSSSNCLLQNTRDTSVHTYKIDYKISSSTGHHIRCPYFDGTLKTISTETYETMKSGTAMCLFGTTNDNSNAYLRIMEFKWFESDGVTLYKHLIPCKRVSDSKAGYFDLIGKAFFTSVNDLTAGQEI